MMPFLKNPRFLSLITGTAFAFALLGGSPLVAQATTLTTIQIQAITNLLQAFGADPITVANVQAVLENQATSTIVASTSTSASSNSTPSEGSIVTQNQNGNGCFVLSSDLHLGSTNKMTDGGVSKLQAFLGEDKNIYPEDAVTGYFGLLTLQAVQRWQAAQGIISYGNPESTGYGYVGPRTRAKMDKKMRMRCMGEKSGFGFTTSSTLSNESNSGDTSASSTQSRDDTSASSTSTSDSGSGNSSGDN